MEDSGYYSERQKQEQMSAVNEERQVNADKLRVGGMCYNEPSPSASTERTTTCGSTRGASGDRRKGWKKRRKVERQERAQRSRKELKEGETGHRRESQMEVGSPERKRKALKDRRNLKKRTQH
jgi:hypothetical protein